ncbi:MAG: dockerin type I domain-containing protein, partial [bacterium]|nr:dockerin type I domain-containing protein [bacterium]
ITLVAASSGQFGSTIIDNRGTSNPADDRILYTPNGGFNGADQFVYTIQDARGIQSSATVTVRVGNADANDIAGMRLSVTDLNGQPIDQITVGGQFQLRGYIQDLRGFGLDRGIFAAYEDVLYTRTLVSPIPSSTNDPDLGFEVQFGPNYQRVREGDIRTPGVINEIGAVQVENGNMPLGSEEQLLFIINMTADAVGTATFVGDPADISPLHDTLTFEPPAPVSFDAIRFGADTLRIVSAGGGGGDGEALHNYSNPFDVNDDDIVSPLDVLLVIHQLNNKGRGGSGEGEGGTAYYTDVDNNGVVTPLDALLVVNHINQGSGSGEGELAAMLSAGALANSAEGLAPQAYTPVSEILITKSSDGKITSRMTDYNYGPAYEPDSRDDVFADSEEGLDELLSQLAPEIEETWRKKSV